MYKILKTIRVTAFKYFLTRRISVDLRKNSEDQRRSPLNIKVHVSSPKETSWNVNITKPLIMVLIWRLHLHQNAKRVPFLQRTLTSVRLHNALQWFEDNNYVRYTKFLVKRPSKFLSKDSHGNEWYRFRCVWSSILLWNGQLKTKIYHLYVKTWKII